MSFRRAAMMCHLLPFIVVSALAAEQFGASVDIPSNVAVRSVSIKGTLLCGKTPYEGAHVRLYRTVQPKNKNYMNQIVDESITFKGGHFHVFGNTEKFPRNESELSPFLSVFHNCGSEELKKLKTGFRRFNVRIPEDYVTVGKKSMKTYNFGILNIEPITHGEQHDDNYIPNTNARLTPPQESTFNDPYGNSAAQTGRFRQDDSWRRTTPYHRGHHQ